MRKLSTNERLFPPTLQAYERGLSVTHLTSVIAAALLFNYEKDPQVGKLQADIQRLGVLEVITEFTGIAREHPVYDQIIENYSQLKEIYTRDL